MKFKQPKYYYTLSDKEKQEWDDFIEIFETIDSKYHVTPCRKPAISKFYLFKSRRKPKYYESWTVSDNDSKFSLLMVEYEIKYEEAHLYGASTKSDTHKYFFGFVTSIRNFGKVLIRPETLADKMSELFQNIEIDIKGFNRFNRKYYLLANDRDKFLRTIDRKTLNFLSSTNGLQLEINGQRCLFRLQKALDKKETLELCSIGYKLNDLFNNA